MVNTCNQPKGVIEKQAEGWNLLCESLEAYTTTFHEEISDLTPNQSTEFTFVPASLSENLKPKDVPTVFSAWSSQN